MQNSEVQIPDISPNFTTEQAATAEIGLTDLVEQGQLLGVTTASVELPPTKIIEVTEMFGNGRVAKVKEGLAKDNLELESIPTEALMDRLLGIDGLIEFKGEIFGIDVTTGKGTVLYNKKAKATELQPIYRQLGIDTSSFLDSDRKSQMI